MLNHRRLIVIGLLTLGLSACSTVRPLEPIAVPNPPKLPPATYLTPCPRSLATLATNRPVEDAEAYETVIGWAGTYHECKERHDYLRGWFDGQQAIPEPKPAEPNKGLLGRLGF